MDRWVGKVAIVTGASSGIGEAIAETLVKHGMKVIGLARRVDRMRERAEKYKNYKGEFHALKCDVTCEEDILNAFEWTTMKVGVVHVLVNNAGVIQPTNLIAGDTNKWKNIIDTNILGLCIATREAVKIMTAHNVNGHIVHINSVTGQSHIYFPTLSVYGSTKHAVSNLTEMLRHELVANKLPIKITSISPGLVATEMINKDTVPIEFRGNQKDLLMLESEDIADAVIYVLGASQRVQINELTIRPAGTVLF